MSNRPKITRGLWASVRNKTLKKKNKKAILEPDDSLYLTPSEVDILLGRLRVILAHVEGNAEPNDILFLSSGGLAADAKEAALVLVDALANDDTLFLVKSLQSYSCATLGSVVKLALMCSPEPLVPGKVCRLLLNSCQKYAEYFEQRDDEKVEEMGATLERFSQQSSLDILEGLCQCLKRLPMPKDELAYIFAPLVLLPKISMLSDENLSESEINANFELLAAADAVIEAMEFMIEKADILFDSRSRKKALLQKGFSQHLTDALEEEEEENVVPVEDETHLDFRQANAGEPHQDEQDPAHTDETTSNQDDTDAQIEGRDTNGPETIHPASENSDDVKQVPPPLLSQTTDFHAGTEDLSSETQSFSSAAGLSGANFEEALHMKEPVCTATVLFDYDPVEDGEIALVCGETVEVMEIEDDGWWYGKNKAGMIGVFPGVYVQKDDPQNLNQSSLSSDSDDSSVSTPLERKCAEYEALLQDLKKQLFPRFMGGKLPEDGSYGFLSPLVSELLQRVDELEKENQQLRTEAKV